MNKKNIIWILFSFFIFFVVYYLIQYKTSKKEFLALKLKVELLSKDKRKSYSWIDLKKQVSKKKLNAIPSYRKKKKIRQN